jgi:hypothetical protein
MFAVIMGIVLFYWFAFMGTIWAWVCTIINLCQLKFIRASLWFCTGTAMLVWWDGRYHWKEFLPVYIAIVGAGVIAAGWRHSNSRRSFTPAGTTPPETSNVVPFIKATRDERELVMRIQGHCCANPYCNMDLRRSVPHWDHIIPRSKGGTDSVHNMQWLCDTCNLNKGTTDWLEFLFRYSTRMGMDPNVNQEPWQKWITSRTKNGLSCYC